MAEKDEKIVTQEETGETAPIDEIESRVEAEMKLIEGRAKERVAQGLDDEELGRQARQQKEQGRKELLKEK